MDSKTAQGESAFSAFWPTMFDCKIKVRSFLKKYDSYDFYKYNYSFFYLKLIKLIINVIVTWSFTFIICSINFQKKNKNIYKNVTI